MNLPPRFSFVMPAWKAGYIKQAISSILGQTCKDLELIIVDDCSPEPLHEIISGFSDARIRYIRNQENLGGKDLVLQWNHCITYASGDFIVLAGDDDIYQSTFCEECLRLVEKYPSIDLIRSSVEEIDENGNRLYNDKIPAEFTSKYEFLYLWVTGQLYTCIGNFAFRRSALLAMGGFISFPCAFGTDVATPIALSRNGVANMSDRLFSFRISPFHLSSDKSRYIEKLEGISQLSEWLQTIDYDIPENHRDQIYYEVINPNYLHTKVVYEYFNLVIKFLPLNKLNYLKYCRLATTRDKIMIVLRWVKHKMINLTFSTR